MIFYYSICITVYIKIEIEVLILVNLRKLFTSNIHIRTIFIEIELHQSEHSVCRFPYQFLQPVQLFEHSVSY